MKADQTTDHPSEAENWPDLQVRKDEFINVRGYIADEHFTTGGPPAERYVPASALASAEDKGRSEERERIVEFLKAEERALDQKGDEAEESEAPNSKNSAAYLRDAALQFGEAAALVAALGSDQEKPETAQARHERLRHSASASFTRCPDPGCQMEASQGADSDQEETR